MNKFICMYIHVNISKRAQTTGNNGFFSEKNTRSQTKMYTIYTQSGKK